MAYPDLPASLPPFLSQVHTREPLPLFAEQPLTTGTRRKRRLRTVALPPIVVQIEWELSQAQLSDLEVFYEVDLVAGSLPFNVPVAALGPTLGTIEIRNGYWVEPYVATPNDVQRWHVSGKIMLIEPKEDPVLVPAIRTSTEAWELMEVEGGVVTGNSTPPNFIPWISGSSGTDTAATWGYSTTYLYLRRTVGSGTYVITWAPTVPGDASPVISQVLGSVYGLVPASLPPPWAGGVWTIHTQGSFRYTVLTFTTEDGSIYIDWAYQTGTP